jgi:hypothetical protein
MPDSSGEPQTRLSPSAQPVGDASVTSLVRGASYLRRLAIDSKDHATLRRHSFTELRIRVETATFGSRGATGCVTSSPSVARSARPPVMNVARRPASFGVRCDVATQVSPCQRLITTKPESLCHVARSAERSPSVMNSRRCSGNLCTSAMVPPARLEQQATSRVSAPSWVAPI